MEKLTKAYRDWLTYLATEPGGRSRGYEDVRQRCRRAGWTVWNRSTQRWHITEAGRLALSQEKNDD